MMQRITYHFNSSPIIFIAPHGYKGDDYNTDHIVAKAAEHINASFIINHGWERSDKVDFINDKADCNNFYHMVDVVKDEFLLPYVRLCKRIKTYHGKCLAIFIHGISQSIRKDKNYNDLDMIIGYGQGTPKSLTCTEGMKNKFVYELSKDKLNCYVGEAGGKYSGFSKSNMNQYWRKHQNDERIFSFQLEIIKDLREDKLISEMTAQYIAEAALNTIHFESYYLPTYFKLRYI